MIGTTGEVSQPEATGSPSRRRAVPLKVLHQQSDHRLKGEATRVEGFAREEPPGLGHDCLRQVQVRLLVGTRRLRMPVRGQ